MGYNYQIKKLLDTIIKKRFVEYRLFRNPFGDNRIGATHSELEVIGSRRDELKKKFGNAGIRCCKAKQRFVEENIMNAIKALERLEKNGCRQSSPTRKFYAALEKFSQGCENWTK